MGKAGKAKKQRSKALNSQFRKQVDVLKSEIIVNTPSDDEDSDTESTTGSSGSTDISESIRILNLLGQRHDIYESKQMKQLRTIIFPLIELQIQRGSHFEPNTSSSSILDGDLSLILDTRKLAVLIRSVSAFCGDHEVFLSPESKPFRAALHPLVLFQQRRMSHKPSGPTTTDDGNQTHSARVSSAFRSRDWPLALTELYAMHRSSECPKLGALQRWVRECDFALQLPGSDAKTIEQSTEDSQLGRKNTSLLLLDAVMRVALPKKIIKTPEISKKLVIPSKAAIHHHLTTCHSNLTEKKVPSSTESTSISDNFGSKFLSEKVKVLSHVKGACRRPPSDTDLNIFTMAPQSITFTSQLITPKRVDIEKVTGTFLMQNVLSYEECSQLICAAEAIGYSHDAVAGIDNIVLCADDSLLSPIFTRCRHLLPQDGLVGINSRFRFFRYKQGVVYRPHIDGSWPGSGVVNGEYVDDAFNGTQNSKLTFLLYLNGDEDFKGGCTTFFVPGQEPGNIDARAVHPQAGAVLVFPHGTVSSPVHEGSEISEGCHKYVIRTDVLYSTAKI